MSETEESLRDEAKRLRAQVARLKDEKRAAYDAWRIERWTHSERVRTMGRAYGRLSAKYARLHKSVCWLPMHLGAPLKVQMVQGLVARMNALNEWICESRKK